MLEGATGVCAAVLFTLLGVLLRWKGGRRGDILGDSDSDRGCARGVSDGVLSSDSCNERSDNDGETHVVWCCGYRLERSGVYGRRRC